MSAQKFTGIGRNNSTIATALKSSEKSIQREYQLELVSPGFLASLGTIGVDSELSALVLRKHLVQWWRIMHINSLPVEKLEVLEDAIWGVKQEDTVSNSSIQLEITPDSNNSVATEYNKNQIKVEKRLEKPTRNNLTQGLFYLLQSRPENGSGTFGSNQRYFFSSVGDKWKLKVSVPQINRTSKKIIMSPDLLLNQIEASLWLLIKYGGIGALSDKGFGSLQAIELPSINSIQDCIESGKRLREESSKSQDDLTSNSILENCVGPIILPSKEQEPWRILDSIGTVLQEFDMQLWSNRNSNTFENPQTDLNSVLSTQISPVQWSLVKNFDNSMSIQIVAFPSMNSHDYTSKKETLEELFSYFKKRFEEFFVSHLPQVGEIIKATLLPKRTELGKWRASWISGEMKGIIINSEKIPVDLNPGDGVKLEVKVPSEDNAEFIWKNPD